MKSKQFRNTKTGKIVELVPICTVGDYEEIDELTARDHIQLAAQMTRKESFIESYQDGISDADALGVGISKWAEWGGDTIAEAFFSALEDSNYHTTRADFVLLWNDREGTDFDRASA